jgi:hypothetical protein
MAVNRQTNGQLSKGSVLNPRGRPKGLIEFRQWARDFTDKEGRGKIKEIALDENHKRQFDALIFLAESGYGKPPQEMKLGGNGPLHFLVTYDDSFNGDDNPASPPNGEAIGDNPASGEAKDSPGGP